MFERFTAAARSVVAEAANVAEDLEHPLVGTEHLLIALASDGGCAGQVLREAGIDGPSLRATLARLVEPAPPLLDQGDSEALRSVGIDLDAVLSRMEATFGPAALSRAAGSGRRGRRWPRSGLGPRAKKVVELALREATAQHDHQIGSGHLLLGLIREGEGLGARLLVDAGADLGTLRRHTLDRMSCAA